MAICRLDNELWFPDPHYGEPDGLIAIGGDLSVDRLLLAYSNGIFPWYAHDIDPTPHWYCPLDRFVIFPKEIHVSHSMRQLMKKNPYRLSFNEDFDGVIEGCSTVDARDLDYGAWLSQPMIAAYRELHRMGFAASVEVWDGKELVGGLYGVCLGKGFFGESMFSLAPSASKLALIHLARTLEKVEGTLIDCQFETPHLLSMGGRHISYKEYMEIISQ